MVEKIFSETADSDARKRNNGPDSTIHRRIRAKMEEFSNVQKKTAEYILENANKVIKMSISELAQSVGAKSESSIVRFYRILGFSGYHDFKVTLATEIAGSSFYTSYEDITIQDDITTITEKFFRSAAHVFTTNLRSLSGDLIRQAAELISKARRLIFIGYGTSGTLASEAAFRFLRLGITCYYSPDSHTNAIALANSQEGDVVLAISNPGESRDVVIPLDNARPAAKIIALTASTKSQLVEVADVPIVISAEEKTYRTDAMISRLVYSGIISVLYIDAAIRRGNESLDCLKRSRKALNYLKY